MSLEIERRSSNRFKSLKRGALYGTLVLATAIGLTTWQETIVDCRKKITGDMSEDSWFERTTRNLGLRFANVPSDRLLRIASTHREEKSFKKNAWTYCSRDLRDLVLRFQ